MTKRRRQRSEAQKASARRGREAQAAAASSPNAAAIVLATAGAPAPGASLAAFAAIGRFDRTPITQVRWNRPLRLLPLLRTLQPQQSLHSQPGGNAEHPPLPTYVSSSLPVEATALLTHAPMRRALTRAATALRYTALRCAAVRWKALCCAALHCTALALAMPRAAHWQLSLLSTPTARVRTLRCGAGWSCGSDGDRRVLRDDDAAFVGPAS
jgi:hypothetical protein